MNCYLDAETTGLDCSKHAIIQFAVYIPAKNAKLNIKMMPHRGAKFSEEAARVNGFTKEAILADDKRLNIETAAIELERFLKRHFGSKPAYVIGHNSDFDRGFVSEWLDRAKIVKFGSLFKKHWGCTQKMACEFKEAELINPDSLHLTELCKYFNIELNNAHDALADTIATAKLHGIFLKYLQSGDRGILNGRILSKNQEVL